MAANTQDNKYLEVGDKELLGYGDKGPPSRSPSQRRKSGESSPGHSEYDEESLIEAPSNAVSIIDAFNSKSGYNVRLKNEEGITMYYIDHSAFTPKKPDVTFHAGAEKSDPIVGVCRWSSMYSKAVVIGLGDPSKNESGVIWEDMKTESSRKFEWVWKFENPNPFEAGESPARNFVWKRASKEDRQDADVEGSSWSTKNFKLIEEKTGQVVAIFVSNRMKSWHKLGKYKVFVDYGEKWRLMMLLTGAALIEMSRRRARHRRASAHGG